MIKLAFVHGNPYFDDLMKAYIHYKDEVFPLCKIARFAGVHIAVTSDRNKELLARGLIEMVEMPKFKGKNRFKNKYVKYVVTPKGEKVLEYCDKIKSLMNTQEMKL